MMDALKKAGMKEEDLRRLPSGQTSTQLHGRSATEIAIDAASGEALLPTQQENHDGEVVKEQKEVKGEDSPPRRKSVTFAEDTNSELNTLAMSHSRRHSSSGEADATELPPRRRSVTFADDSLPESTTSAISHSRRQSSSGSSVSPSRRRSVTFADDTNTESNSSAVSHSRRHSSSSEAGSTESPSRRRSVTFADDTNTESNSSAVSHSLRRTSSSDVDSTDSSSRRRSVTFADDTKSEPTSSGRLSHSLYHTPTSTTTSTEKPVFRVHNNFDPGSRVIELDAEDREIGTTAPTMPLDDSPEDAALRREMLAYGLNEMGSVVAQLDLEEGETESYYTEDEEDDDKEHESATDDEENQFGMSTRNVLEDDYRKEMLELEQRLNLRYFENVGPQAAPLAGNENVDIEQLAKHTARVTVKSEEDMPNKTQPQAQAESHQVQIEPQAASTSLHSKDRSKRGVRFAEELDVSPGPAPSEPTPTTTASAVRDTVLERAPQPSSTSTAAPEPPSTRKPSRFRASRAAASSPSVPLPPSSRNLTTPKNSPLAAHIVESAPSTMSSSAATEPDEFDPALLKKQVAEEYYRTRNRLIGKQGGFRREMQEEMDMQGEEEEEEFAGAHASQTTMDVEDQEQAGDENVEEPKKMSLFRKARLKKDAGW